MWKEGLDVEQIENPMVMAQIEYNTDFEKQREYLAEREDMIYEDKISEEYQEGKKMIKKPSEMINAENKFRNCKRNHY